MSQSAQIHQHAGKIVMVGPDRSYIGGISAVVNTLLEEPLIQALELRYQPSVRAGSRVSKLKDLATLQLQFIRKLGSRSAPELVHIHCGGWVSLIRKVAYMTEARLRGCKVVLHAHGAQDLLDFAARGTREAMLMDAAFRLADSMVVVSGVLKRYIHERLGADFPVHRIFNPVDTAVWDGVWERPPRSGPPTVLFLGWMLEFKGIFELLEILPALRERVPGARILFGGDGADMERMRERIAQAGLEESAILLGWIQGEEKEQAFMEADLFCLPSHSEGLPITILEAMSAGLPVVSTAISGIPDEVTHEETGLLYTPGDTAALLDCLATLLANPDQRRRYGQAGRARVEQHFSRPVVSQQLCSLWTAMLEQE